MSIWESCNLVNKLKSLCSCCSLEILPSNPVVCSPPAVRQLTSEGVVSRNDEDDNSKSETDESQRKTRPRCCRTHRPGRQLWWRANSVIQKLFLANIHNSLNKDTLLGLFHHRNLAIWNRQLCFINQDVHLWHVLPYGVIFFQPLLVHHLFYKPSLPFCLFQMILFK